MALTETEKTAILKELDWFFPGEWKKTPEQRAQEEKERKELIVAEFKAMMTRPSMDEDAWIKEAIRTENKELFDLYKAREERMAAAKKEREEYRKACRIESRILKAQEADSSYW